MNPTLYDILGVSRDASREEIRAAWRDAADRFEPGEGGSPAQFRLFNEAAEVLLDPERRRAYDATLHEEDPEPAEEPVGETPAGKVPGPPMPGASSAAAPEIATALEKSAAEESHPVASGGSTHQTSSGAHGVDRVGGRWPVVAVLVVLAVVAVAAGAYYGSRGWHAYRQNEQAQRYQQVLDRAPAAAETAAVAVLSYDHRSLEADRDAASKFLTADYREQYVETFDKLVMDSAKQTKAEVEAHVRASAPVSTGPRDADRVPVLLFVDQTTSRSGRAEPTVALNRVRLDMVRVDGTWLVDGITSY